MNVGLVVVQPTVRDRKGRSVSDLREPNFEVYEDGVRQTIRLFRTKTFRLRGLVTTTVEHAGETSR